jgi:predicted permease
MTDWKRYIRENLPPLGLDAERELEIIDELALHLDAVYEDAIADGTSQQEAFANASASIRDWQFLECELAREERAHRNHWRSQLETEHSEPNNRKGDWLMKSIIRDLRYGWRLLLKSPGFLGAAVLSLALGIGANTAIFSLMDAVLLKMLPVDHPEQLYFIANVGARGENGSPPYPCFERFREHSQSFLGMAAFNQLSLRLMIDGQVEETAGQRASGNYFSLLGVQPILGRVFTPEDDAIPGQGGRDGLAAVISYNYWTRRFGQNPAVIGKAIKVGDRSATIIGVTGPDFYGIIPGVEVNISLPMMSMDPAMLAMKESWWFNAVGRLKPGVTAEQARAELDAMFQVYMDETTISAEARRDGFARIELPSASRGLETLRRQYSKPLQALMVIVVLTLLIACANVANLLLTRATARRKEFAVRMALGASRTRLVRQMLIESLLLVGLGGALGLAIARWGSGYLVKFFATGRDRSFIETPLDSRVLAFTIGVSLLTGLLFGLAPALKAAQVDPNPALKGGGGGPMRLGKALVVVQVALSLLLLVGAGLFLRTLRNLRSNDAGFQAAGVLLLEISPPESLYPRPRRMNLWKEILERIQHLPDVESASLSALTPLDGNERGIGISVAGFTQSSERDSRISLNQVSAGFLSTMKIQLVEGRDFRAEDNEAATKVALLNETAAKFYFRGRSALGGLIKRLGQENAYQVVGVVKDSRYENLRDPDSRRLYVPMPQAFDGLRNMGLAVRAVGAGSETLKAVRHEIDAAGSDIFIRKITTLEDQVDQSLSQERLVSTLSMVFGLLALVLAAIGLYGVLSYDTARRTHEIGVRMTLGARATDVVQLVIREAMFLIVIGVALGLVAAFVAANFISSLLFGLSAKDPLTFTIAAMLMLLTAAVAAYLPARRASRVDPMVALRIE